PEPAPPHRLDADEARAVGEPREELEHVPVEGRPPVARSLRDRREVGGDDVLAHGSTSRSASAPYAGAGPSGSAGRAVAAPSRPAPRTPSPRTSLLRYLCPYIGESVVPAFRDSRPRAPNHESRGASPRNSHIRRGVSRSRLPRLPPASSES